jgi:carbon-monoxide dehydrogenase large subunit
MTDMSNSPIGKPLQRREDYRFLTGAGQYTDDVVQAHQTYGKPDQAPWPGDCSGFARVTA